MEPGTGALEKKATIRQAGTDKLLSGDAIGRELTQVAEKKDYIKD